jgi:hypothetical protein
MSPPENNNRATKRRRTNNGNKALTTTVSGWNKLPTNLYPRIVQYMTGNQIAKMASASPNFFRWVRNKPQYLAKMSLARRNKLFATRLLPGNQASSLWEFLGFGKKKYLTPKEYNFLEHKANYSAYRGAAFNRGTNNPRYSIIPALSPFMGSHHPTHNKLMRHLALLRPLPGQTTPYMRQFITPSLQNKWAVPNVVPNPFGPGHIFMPQRRGQRRLAQTYFALYEPSVHNKNRNWLPTQTAFRMAVASPNNNNNNYGPRTRKGIITRHYHLRLRKALARARQRIANRPRANNRKN